MRFPTVARLVGTTISSMAGIGMLLAVTGCSLLRSTIGAYETGPNGIARPQQELREALVRADFAAALGWPEDDALLRALATGASSYYASQFSRSVAVLDSAALLADDRVTNSVSANAVALVTNDLARPYQARRTERLFIPYYAMLAYARLDRWEDAAVEARRLSGLLAQYAGDRSDSERATHATLHYLSGVVFARAGEKTDAQVAYRLARALAPEQVDSVRARTARNEGEIVVAVERGFVAHRATETISIFLGDDDERTVARRGNRESSDVAEVVSRVVAAGGAGKEEVPVTSMRKRHHDHDAVDDDGYWLRVAFPSVRRAPRVHGEAKLVVDGEPVNGATVSTLLDDAVSADEGRERVALLARATARAAAKYAVTKAVKDKKGEVAGSIANFGASLMERADVRSWHLLPQTVTLLRIRVPAGTRRVQLDLGETLARTDLGDVVVHAGEVTIVPVRVWRENARTGLLAMNH
jgi:hypothetical protein